MQQIRSEDWFVTIDLKDAYFHISTYPYPQEVPEVHFWGQSIPISGSSIQPSIITPHIHIGSSASRCHPGPQERVGVTAKSQKECAFSTTEDHLPWCGMGLNVDAGVPVTVMYRVHPVGCKKYKARPVTHCQTVSETVRSYGSSIQRYTFWTAVHETFTVVAQDQRVFPEEKA